MSVAPAPGGAQQKSKGIPSYPISNHVEGLDDWSIPQHVLDNPLFVEVGNAGTSNLTAALLKLHSKMKETGHGGLVSSKKPFTFLGKSVPVGHIGLWEFASKPRLSLQSGMYWNFSPRHQFRGTASMTATTEFLGLFVR